ncbi:MAG TPA: quinolinate synthase NadA [Candidatus Thermoplasmatota archaeon]|nr:quinolinate synthase NadA [Candidatus Thermoplasmatota archaeon]
MERYEQAAWKHLSPLAELPQQYQGMSEEERSRRIAAAKAKLGDRLVILGHNYQNDEIIRWSDATGDSFQLSVKAKNTKAEYIVFCGVSFMAETADLVTDGSRVVIQPSMEASCPMAGMAEMVQVYQAWEHISSVVGESNVIPVTYVNSYADLKAFTGEKGGVICTSANADKAFKWAFERAEKIFFTPDKHLANNTAAKMGIPKEQVILYNPWMPKGGVSDDQLRNAKVILWEGYCQVHERFQVHHVEEVRRDYPGIKVVTHPECRKEVCDLSDYVGSTSQMIDWIAKQPAGSKIAVGTEIHMVKRLAKENPDKFIVQLCGALCLDCNAMRQVQPEYLAWVLESLVEGRVVNRIRVDDEDRANAKLSLDRMLAL